MKMRLFPRSLRRRLAQSSLLLLACVLLAVGLLQYFFMKDFVYRNKAESLQTQLMSLPPDPALLQRAAGNMQPPKNNTQYPPRNTPFVPLLFQPDLTLMYISLNGEAVTLSQHDAVDPLQLSNERYSKIINEQMDKKEKPYYIETGSGSEQQLLVLRIAGPPEAPQGVIQVGFHTASLDKLLLTQLSIYTVLALAALLCAAILYAITLYRALAPLSRIVAAAEKTDAGNLTVRLPVHQGQQEIDTLSEAFNGMLQRLDQAFEAEREMTDRMRQFIADASHELRTPLTSIHGFIDVLLRGAASNPQQLQSALTSMKGESQRIIRLVEELLTLAKLDQSPKLQLSPVHIDKLLSELLPQLQLLAGNRKVELNIYQPAAVYAEADQLKQVLLNLFQNAVQHTDEVEGVIKLVLYTERQHAIIRMEDNGSGIPTEHLPHLFERFYRSEASRSRLKGGFGLGLAISKSIVESYKGTIRAVSPPEGAIGNNTTGRSALQYGENEANPTEKQNKKGSEFIIQLPILSDC
ncbi:sensor histidine kinase [Paenibacillus sp. IITD108]|uniref:sensor histidine kinase n=1 Tax=Paenibacillus sp. IITD108 TaxID=3116649 RepID=UPI002F410A68